MSITTELLGTTSVLPSVFDAEPDDFGGVHARKGFAYQDHVAAGFYIKMLLNSSLLEVSCETYDDIRLAWQCEIGVSIEFVQVKGEHPDQLWTIAKLCERAKSPKSPNGHGTSILEKSLSRDKFTEPSLFRIVTCRQVNSDLDLLVSRTRGHEHRSLEYPQFKMLADTVLRYLSGAKSLKQNDTAFWLINAQWDVVSENDIASINQQQLSKVLYEQGERCDPDTVQNVYENLLALAKNTAEYGPEKWKLKSVYRNELLNKIREWITPYPDKSKSEKLAEKLTDAGLDATCLSAARDQQMYYMRKRREPNFLNTEEIDDIDNMVLGKLHELRSSLNSGHLNEDGVKFHNSCLTELKTIIPSVTKSSEHATSSYLSGCMYEITARCSHRFTKIQQ